jgi:hypothetical protein
MNEPLDPKVALAYASMASGVACIVAGIVMSNPSTLAVGAGLLGAPGVAKGVGSEPQGPGPAPDAGEAGSDEALVAPGDSPFGSAAESHGLDPSGNEDVTAEFDDDLTFEE